MRKNSSIKYGLIAGVATIGYFLLFYFVNPRIMLNSWIQWGSLIIYLAAMVLAVKKERAIAESLGFREGLKTAFVVFTLTSALYYLFYHVLYTVVDPGLTDLQREIMLENISKMKAVLGEDRALEMKRNLEKEDLSASLSSTLLSFSWSLIGGFILAAVVAAIYKRN